MDQFLETYNLQNLNQEETNNLNMLITSIEIESVMKKFPGNKSPGPDSFGMEIYQTYKEELIPIFLRLFQKFGEDRTLPNSFYEVTINLIQQPDRHYKKKKKENYRPISMFNIYVKILNSILAR